MRGRCLDTCVVQLVHYQTHQRGLTDPIAVHFGSIAGLFVGCSVLSLIELLYFFTLRLYWYAQGLALRPGPAKTQPPGSHKRVGRPTRRFAPHEALRA